jgi:uncharacterized protein YgiM (DUF1202 family)
MKMNCWLILGAMLSTSLLAQQATTNVAPPTAFENPAATPALSNAPAAEPSLGAAPAAAPDTNAPSLKPAKPAKKKAPAKKKKAIHKPAAPRKDLAAELKTVPLVSGPAVVEASHVNVRGQPRLVGEVLTRLNHGDAVTVVEEITHKNSGPEEPSAWAKILLPTNVHVWVSGKFIDAATQTVNTKRLNLRGGPGENYSVLGRLEKGEAVKQIGAKGDWTEIEAPTNAYAFIAAQYLKQEAGGAAAIAGNAAPATPEAAASTNAVAEATPVTPATIEPADTNATAAATGATPGLEAGTNAMAATTAPAAPEPPPKRIVQREGVVRGTFSIQAPTKFELFSPETKHVIDYLYTTSSQLDLARYKGLRIIVTGEEGLEERWGNTPVLTIQKIQVVE